MQRTRAPLSQTRMRIKDDGVLAGFQLGALPRRTLETLYPKSGKPLDKPKRCHSADPVGRDRPQPKFKDIGNSKLLGQLYNAENRRDERKLPHLDADIEGEQRKGNVALWKADIDQRAGEAKAMQETEGKCHRPRPAGGKA